MEPWSPEGSCANWAKAVRVADGFLVGTDAGEFGGGVWWFSEDGEESYHVVEANVRGFVPHGQEVLVVDGLGHMGLNRGFVHSLNMAAGGRWEVRGTTDLGATAELVLPLPDGALLILTGGGAVQYRDGAVTWLVRSDYRSFYPNSIAMTAEGRVYVGMRYAVVELSLDGTSAGSTERWLVPPSCTRLVGAAATSGCRCEN